MQSLEELKKLLEDEPSFRLEQVKKAVFSDLIDNWDGAIGLPKKLREKLSEKYALGQEFKNKEIFISNDNQTIKALFILQDDLKIESVLMKHSDNRRTVCVSSQAGCAMNCKFCAAGHQGFKRNLSISEIIGQVLFFARLLKKSNEKVSNIVFMGMGEPLLNYKNVLEAIKILNDEDGFNIGARRISVSTSGIIEGIEKLAKEGLQINLAVSLHAPNNILRSKLMPINKAYPIEKILSTVKNYMEETERRVMFEYLMIDGINDPPILAKELASLLKTLEKPLYFVNLIGFNPAGHCEFKPSPTAKVKKFREILEKSGISVTERYRFGREIKAACGQLAGIND